MERLTEKGFNYSDAAIVENMRMVTVSAAMCRLAAYEDTGLEPQTISEILDSVSEWYDAYKEGRLLVLPCKVGGDLWANDRDGKPRRMVLDTPDIRCHCAKEDNLCMVLCDSPKDGICAYRLKNDGTDFGKTIFRTREEAEAKLKEAKRDG